MTHRYLCRKCNKIRKVEQPLPAPSVLPRCPECRTKMQKIFGVPNFQFRGKGFYSTDK